MILQIMYTLQQHPYADEPSSKNEMWANIKLQVLDDAGMVVRVIFDIQWDILVLLNWLLENEKALVNEDAPDEIAGSSSIAKGIYEFYEKLDTELEEDAIVDKVFEYRSRHGLGFSLKGVDVDDVYIGKLNEISTISFFDDGNEWNYDFNIEEFLLKIRKISNEVEKAKKEGSISSSHD